MSSPPPESVFEQECCLGRVLGESGKGPPLYLVKWKGYSGVHDITAEAEENLTVPPKDWPMLKKGKKPKVFEAELDKLLKDYLAGEQSTPAKRAKIENAQALVENVAVNQELTCKERGFLGLPRELTELPKEATEDPMAAFMKHW
eukprot:RCo018855